MKLKKTLGVVLVTLLSMLPIVGYAAEKINLSDYETLGLKETLKSEEMKEEVESNLTYKAYITISNEIHEEATFYTYEEAKEWCDMAHTEIEEYEYDDGIQYIAYILIGGDIHDSAEFDTKEEAEKWCDAMTTEIEEVFEE